MDYKAGFCRSDCVIGNRTRLNGFGTNTIALNGTSKTAEATTVQTGFPHDLNKNGHSFGSNGHTLGKTSFEGVRVNGKRAQTNGITKKSEGSQLPLLPITVAEPNGSYYKDQNGKSIPRRRKSNVTVKESFEQCSLLDALYTYLCYAFLAIVGYVNDLVRPRDSTEKFRSVRLAKLLLIGFGPIPSGVNEVLLFLALKELGKPGNEDFNSGLNRTLLEYRFIGLKCILNEERMKGINSVLTPDAQFPFRREFGRDFQSSFIQYCMHGELSFFFLKQ